MNTKKVGKVTLALALISLGVILLFRNSLNVEAVLEIYLPAVFIMLGIEVLVSKLYYEKKEYEVKADIGSIIITFLLLFAVGMFLASAKLIGGNIFNIELPNVNVFNEIRYRNEREIEGSVEILGAPNLVLESDYSDIEIVESDGDEIVVEGIVKYRYNEEKNSNLDLGDIINVANSGDTASIIYKKREVELEKEIGIEDISYRIYIPENMKSSTLKLSYTDTSIDGVTVEDIDIKSNYSDLYLSKLKGDLDISLNYGEATIKELEGDSRIDTNYTETVLSGLKGSLDIDTNYGDVELSEVSGGIVANLNYTDFEVANTNPLDGGLRVVGRYSDIGVKLSPEQEGEFDITTRSGDIDMGVFKNRSELNISNSRVSGRIGEEDIPIYIESRMGDVDFE